MQLSGLFLLICVLTLYSCERGSEKKQYTLKGQLVKSCEDQLGVANVRLGLLRVDKGQSMSGGSGVEWLAYTRTDAGGHFELTYEGDIKANFYLQYYPDIGSMLLMGIPKNKSLDLGLVYHGRQEVDLIMKASTTETFTNKDTLYMGGAAAIHVSSKLIWRKIPGPFYDGQVLVELSDYEGTVQLYAREPENLYDNIDLDFDHRVNYHFPFDGPIYPDDTRITSFFTYPCEENTIYIYLDSLRN